eukprot:gene10063-2485_t
MSSSKKLSNQKSKPQSSFRLNENQKKAIKESLNPYLEIVLLRGINLPVRDMTGKSDPYLIFKVGNEATKSQKVFQNLNPDFKNEEILVKVDLNYLREKGILEIECWDWDPFKKPDWMGKNLMSIQNLVKDKTTSQSVTLDQESGIIEFTITARNFGLKEGDEKVEEKSFLSTSEDPLGSVLQKLENSLYASQFSDKDDLKKFAAILSNPQKLKATYLSTQWADTLKIEEDLSQTKEIKVEENVETEDELDEDDNFKNDKMQGSLTEKQLKSDIRVKIVVVDQDAKSQFKKGLRQFLSPVLSKIDMIPQMGMFHSALMIGPWMIEWNNSGLCIPRKCVSKAAMLSADIDAISTIKNLEDVADTLSQTIVSWNISKGYQTSGGDKKNVGNCQDFIESILNAIGIKIQLEGPLGEFLHSIRENGSTKLEFKMDEEFRKKFEIETKSKVFTTHKDLDQFVDHLIDKEPFFEKKYKLEYQFLKSFDRAFWMRHLKIAGEISKLEQKIRKMEKILKQQKDNLSVSDLKDANKQVDEIKSQLEKVKKEDADICPNTVDFEELCPFKDPRDTHSIWL